MENIKEKSKLGRRILGEMKGIIRSNISMQVKKKKKHFLDFMTYILWSKSHLRKIEKKFASFHRNTERAMMYESHIMR